MKILVSGLLFAISCISLFAQPEANSFENSLLNNVNLNILGDASLLSLNYERLFRIQEGSFIAGTVGFGYAIDYDDLSFFCDRGCNAREFLSLPHHATINIGVNKYFLEVGLGGTYLYNRLESYYKFYPIIGYRKQLPDSKKNFRIFIIIPLAGLDDEPVVVSPIGVSFGRNF